MATHEEITAALNRLVAAKLRSTAADLEKLAGWIEQGRGTPDPDILKAFDALDDTKKVALTRAAELGIGIVEGGKAGEDTSYRNGDRAVPGVFNTPITGLHNPSPLNYPEGA